jgi:hypothetical protein
MCDHLAVAGLQDASWDGQHGVTIFFVTSGDCISAAVVVSGCIEHGRCSPSG